MNLKKLCYIVSLALVLIFAIQNIAFITVSFFFWEFTLPRSVVLAVTFLLGALVGYGVFEYRHLHRPKK
ncbi:LapA family protein [Alkalimarinus sediminis]|uniref:LapA family protein n=1 Tax=Alkalimarinus sediminis TaxID=1632866 RepID=UPI0032E8C3F5